jgi:AcrR family transcriptional regulator
LTKNPRRRGVRSNSRLTAARGASGAVRADILEAALKIFAKDSFEGASVLDIARVAKTGQPSIHYHFGSKEQLWMAAVDHAMGNLKSFVDAIALTTVDLEPIDVLRVVCRCFVNFSANYPEHALILINEMRVSGERFEWLTEKYLRPVHKHIDTLLENGKRRDQIKDIPVMHLTNTILIALVHFFTIGPMLNRIYAIDVSDPAVVAAHADYTMQILFEGIRT